MEGSVTEADLKAQLMKAVRDTLPVLALRPEDRRTSGIPDIILIGKKMSSWWEVKHCNPLLKDQELQRLNMKRLAHELSAAYYILYEDRGSLSQTIIVEPSRLDDWRTDPLLCYEGHNHRAVVQFMKLVHEGGQVTRT
jgi:hypothetical protein